MLNRQILGPEPRLTETDPRERGAGQRSLGGAFFSNTLKIRKELVAFRPRSIYRASKFCGKEKSRMYLIPWVPARASTGAVKARQRWLGNGTPQRHSALPAQRACHQWCRVPLPQSWGSYYKTEVKSKLQIWPLNICICHLFRVPPMLSCHILFHHRTALKQAGTPQQPESRVRWAHYRLGVRVLGRLAKCLKSAGTSQNRTCPLKMLPIPTLRSCALSLALCPYPF